MTEPREPEALLGGAVGNGALRARRAGRRAAVSWQGLHSHAPLLSTRAQREVGSGTRFLFKWELALDFCHRLCLS